MTSSFKQRQQEGLIELKQTKTGKMFEPINHR